MLNGRTYGPYNDEICVDIAPEGWGFAYKNGAGGFALMNGETYGPYDSIGCPDVRRQNWVFTYTKNGKNYANLNGVGQEINGDFFYGSLEFNSAAQWNFQYISGTERFLNINGEELGPYSNWISYRPYSSPERAEEDGGFIMLENRANGLFINMNDTVSGPYEKVPQFDVAGDRYAFAYKRGGKYFVNIDGNEFDLKLSEEEADTWRCSVFF